MQSQIQKDGFPTIQMLYSYVCIHEYNMWVDYVIFEER